MTIYCSCEPLGEEVVPHLVEHHPHVHLHGHDHLYYDGQGGVQTHIVKLRNIVTWVC